jgi:outer membrane receptor protein involved in Fe transport
VALIFDLRNRNLSEVSTRGIDFSMQYGFKEGDSSINFGLAGTYIIELLQRLTSTSEPFDSVDTIYHPTHWRMRGNVGWQHHGWSASVFGNYTDSYVDNRTSVAAPIGSYTTVDARVAYEFGSPDGGGFLGGVTVALSAQNLFDANPPRTAVVNQGIDMGFDPTNASPMGRLLAVEFSKAW